MLYNKTNQVHSFKSNKWIQMYFSGIVNVISQESVSFSVDKFYKTFCHLNEPKKKTV